MKNTLGVAQNEFLLMSRNWITIVFVILIVIWATVNTMGYSNTWERIQQHPNFVSQMNTFYTLNVSNFFYKLSMLFAFLSMCLGIISIANERSNGSLLILTAKPLYRRDIIIGKFIGMSILLFLLMIFATILFIIPIMIFFESPPSLSDFVLRMSSILIITYLNCSFTLGLVMLFGIILSKAEALVISLAYIAIEWLSGGNILNYMGSIKIIDPGTLQTFAFGLDNNFILYMSPPSFIAWLINATPYIVLMIAEVIIIILINCMLFTREEI
jgi:ABC-2 type transport system permease protein